MRRGCVAFGALALIGVLLVGCGRSAFETREPWRAQAEEACLAAKLVQPSAYMSRAAEIDGPGVCGITYPFKASALASGSVGLTNRLTLACPIIPEIDAWLNGTVQPAAEMYFGTTVSDLRAGSYSCRSRNNQRGAKLSEHSFGNAVDVMGFRLADGREVTIKAGWRGGRDEQDFLREVFVGACNRFSTVLGPGADMFHHDHFHLDLARHNPRGDRRVCKPIIKFEPRLDPDRSVERPIGRPRVTPRRPVEPAPPLEVEDEGDPYAVSSASSLTRTTLVERVSPPPARPATAFRAPEPSRLAGAGQVRPAPTPPRPSGPPLSGPVGRPLVLQPQATAGVGIY